MSFLFQNVQIHCVFYFLAFAVHVKYLPYCGWNAYSSIFLTVMVKQSGSYWIILPIRGSIFLRSTSFKDIVDENLGLFE